MLNSVSKWCSAKRLLSICLGLNLLLAACAPAITPAPPTAAPPASAPAEPVLLTMGSWRTEDGRQMNAILAEFTRQHPNITIQYNPTPAAEYDAVLKAQLASGAGPDLFYLRSYAVARQLYDAGYLQPLTDLPGLQANFAPEMRAPWSTAAGQAYGVPFIATAEAFYYNQDLFQKLGLQVPQTWEDLLTAARAIQAAGYIPFANTSGDTWTMAELVFMGLAPNFIGGYAGRQAYLNGKRCFNDAGVTSAFQAVADLAPFLPPNQAALKYKDSLQLFAQGQAAMWLDGSWSIPFFESEKPAFQWSVFAPPPPAGQPNYLLFHLDAGLGLNAASSHQAEARLFLEWLTSPEFGALLGNELPGFFPLHTPAPKLTNAHANAFLNLRDQASGADVRFAWEKLRQGEPNGYDLIETGATDVVNGRQTPQQAADHLQNGLAQWYAPAQTCGK